MVFDPLWYTLMFDDPLELTSAQYNELVNDLTPLAHWALDEGGGTSAVDGSGNGYTGTYANVTWDPAGFAGTPAPIFNGNTSSVATYSAGLAAALDLQELSMGSWLKVDSVADWTDSTVRFVYDIFSDTDNRTIIDQQAQNNGFLMQHRGGGTNHQRIQNLTTRTTWFHWMMTASTSNSRVRYYIDGALVETDGAPGTYVKAINTTSMAIGNLFTNSSNIGWKGKIRHFALWDRELTTAEVASLAPSEFMV